jgi:hypothetical protein
MIYSLNYDKRSPEKTPSKFTVSGTIIKSILIVPGTVIFYLVQNKNTVPGLTKSVFLIVPGTVNFYLVQNKNTLLGLTKMDFLIVQGTVFLLGYNKQLPRRDRFS